MTQIESRMEPVGVRCERYLADLREVLRSSGMHFGSSENLAHLTQRLQHDGTFREEFSSVCRSIAVREGGLLPPAELLSLLSVAVGGTQINDHAREVSAELRDLLHFATDVVRGPANQAIGESSSSRAASVAPDRIPASSGSAWIQSPPDRGEPEHGFEAEAMSSGPSLVSARGLLARWSRRWWIPASGVALAAMVWTLPRAHTRKIPVASESIAAEAAGRVPGRPSESPLAEEKAAGPAEISPASIAEHSLTVQRGPKLRVGAERRPPRSFGSSRMTVPAARKTGAAPRRVSYASTVRSEPGRRPAPVARVGVLSRPPSTGRAIAGAGEPGRFPPAAIASGSVSSTLEAHRREDSPAYKPNSGAHGRGTFDVSSGVMSANLISARSPDYPRIAEAMHLEGAVILQAVIGKNGQVLTTHVLRGHYLLRGAAVKAVRTWRYRPFVADGHPVDVATVVTVDFRRAR